MADYAYAKYTFDNKDIYVKAFRANLQYDPFVEEKTNSLAKYIDILSQRLEDNEYYLPSLLDKKPDKLSMNELAILTDAIKLSSAIMDGINYGFSEIASMFFKVFYSQNFVGYANEEDIPEGAIRLT